MGAAQPHEQPHELGAELLELALATAREAAALVAGRRAAGVTVAATKSSAVDVVTEADRASEALIRERILAARPDDGFVGEEGGSGKVDTGGDGVGFGGETGGHGDTAPLTTIQADSSHIDTAAWSVSADNPAWDPKSGDTQPLA